MNLILSIVFSITPIDEWCYRVINSSILQEVFSSVSIYSSWNKERVLEVR